MSIKKAFPLAKNQVDGFFLQLQDNWHAYGQNSQRKGGNAGLGSNVQKFPWIRLIWCSPCIASSFDVIVVCSCFILDRACKLQVDCYDRGKKPHDNNSRKIRCKKKCHNLCEVFFPIIGRQSKINNLNVSSNSAKFIIHIVRFLFVFFLNQSFVWRFFDISNEIHQYWTNQNKQIQ